MSTSVEDAVSEATVTESNGEENKKGRAKQYDWAKERGVEDKSLTADGEKTKGWWDYVEASKLDDDKPSAKMLEEKFFTNKVEYHKYRVEVYQSRYDDRVASFEKTLDSLKARITESQTYLDTVTEHGDEVAERVARAEKLREQYEREMAKLEEAGYTKTGDMEEEPAE